MILLSCLLWVELSQISDIWPLACWREIRRIKHANPNTVEQNLPYQWLRFHCQTQRQVITQESHRKGTSIHISVLSELKFRLLQPDSGLSPTWSNLYCSEKDLAPLLPSYVDNFINFITKHCNQIKHICIPTIELYNERKNW